MRTLIVSQYFTPELTAAAARVHAFAMRLAERGGEVEVICEVPNHPRGIVEPGYRGRAIQRRRLDGFGVSYVWVPASARKRRCAGSPITAAVPWRRARQARCTAAPTSSSPPRPRSPLAQWEHGSAPGIAQHGRSTSATCGRPPPWRSGSCVASGWWVRSRRSSVASTRALR